MPIGTSPYRLVYSKACHLPFELKHQAYWVIKKLNLEMKATEEKGLLQLVEYDEFHLHAYENAKLYKEKTKRWHDRQIQDRWSRPFEVAQMIPHRAVELWNKEMTKKFPMNGQCVKHYWVDHADKHNMSIIFAEESD
ncbi:uncharacterized protein LOC107868971 [Capsicum annuum]|uniref:uncharacterized protein LOC107868971 n=1 Tax=Capsicum annuum TaxID=4072 RepID=UPI001FB117DA|nr:uncharacterized protein LOC107868971 [Capsicum annuum]